MRPNTTMSGVVISAAVLLCSCADGGGVPSGSATRAAVHLDTATDEAGAYDAWEFYGQSAEHASVVVESRRNDGAPGRIEATPLADGTLRVSASIGAESAELELSQSGELLGMYADGDEVRRLLVEAATDLSDRADALTWRGDTEVRASAGGDVAGAQEALGPTQWVVNVQCWFAKIYTHIDARSPERACNPTLTASELFALDYDPSIVFVFHNALGTGNYAVAHWSSSVDRTQWFQELDMNADDSAFYLTLRPTGNDMTRSGYLRFEIYGSLTDFATGVPALWTARYTVKGFAYGLHMKRVEVAPTCAPTACLAQALTCNAAACEIQDIHGSLQPYADLHTMIRVDGN